MVEPKLSCPKAQRGRHVAAKKKKSRKLWGEGKGKFRTTGQFSSATVRGTQVGRDRPLRRDRDAGHRRLGHGARLREAQDRAGPGRQEVPGAQAK